MAAETLKEALKDCVIDFDRRVLITDLLDEYGVNYREAEKIVKQHIEQLEKTGTKYEKRFLVHGREANGNNEIYTVLESEAKLREWLEKLRDAESSLYSVELSGGAKAPAPIFKPMLRCAVELKNVKIRSDTTKVVSATNGNGTTAGIKAEPKVDAKKPKGMDGFTKKTTDTASSSALDDKKDKHEMKKSPPETKKSSKEAKKPSPDEKKSAAQKSTNTKNINNFFTPTAAAGTAKKEERKTTSANKSPTPKKMNDFFKKQDVKAQSVAKEVKQEANVSVQLFDEDDHDDAESNPTSSDEEDKLSALKRDLITSDHERSEEDNDDEGKASSSKNIQKKRRRIEDSDDEDEAPQQKHDKKEEEAINVMSDDEEKAPKSETFLDDEGFVITVKSKKPHVTRKPVTVKISPPTNNKKSPAASSNSKAKPAAASTKTKQGNIMNFFSKK